MSLPVKFFSERRLQTEQSKSQEKAPILTGSELEQRRRSFGSDQRHDWRMLQLTPEAFPVIEYAAMLFRQSSACKSPAFKPAILNSTRRPRPPGLSVSAM